MMWVVRNLLSVKMLNELPQEIFDNLGYICTDILLKQINIFCDENKDNQDPEVQQCINRLNNRFQYINEKEAYLKSKSAREITSTLSNLSYGDVYYGKSEEELLKYKMCIETILSNDSLGKARVITATDYDSFLESLDGYVRQNKLELSINDKNNIQDLKKIVKGNKSLFKSAPHGRTNGTIFTRFYNRREVYEVIYRGIDYLLGNMKSGKKPESWRYL